MTPALREALDSLKWTMFVAGWVLLGLAIRRAHCDDMKLN